MSFMSELEQNAGVRYAGGQNAPIGSFFCPRTNAVFQQAADGTLPAGDWWYPITTSGSSTLAACATAINGLVSGLAYTAANLHVRSGGDAPQVAGTGANDA